MAVLRMTAKAEFTARYLITKEKKGYSKDVQGADSIVAAMQIHEAMVRDCLRSGDPFSVVTSDTLTDEITSAGIAAGIVYGKKEG